MAWPKGVPRKKVSGAPDVEEDTSEPEVSGRIPFRKLWELTRKYGATVRNTFDRQEIESKLECVGYVPEAPKLEEIEDYWTFASRFVGKGPITALDKAGDFSATVYPDGRCDLVKHTLPNRLSRHPGVRYADETIKITNLEQFTSLLYMLLNECDVIFDETVEQFNTEDAEFQRQSEHAEGVKDGTIHGADPRIEQLWIIAEELALTGPHKPTLSTVPFKCALALGLKLVTDEGREKDWPMMSDEVITYANVDPSIAGGIYQRNKEEAPV